MPGEHSSKQYDQDLEDIRSKVLLMGGLVESQFTDAVACFRSGNVEQAEQIIKADENVNRLEVTLDDFCSHLIVRRQPAANDLRTVMATLKVITDLERIGDEATKIARAAKNIQERGVTTINHFETVRVIASSTSDMLHDALDAFARLDEEQALKIISQDDFIDHEFRSIMRNVITFMMEDPRTISAALDTLWVAKAIERIGDHCKNLAEYVIYIVAGKDIRHTNVAHVPHADLKQDTPELIIMAADKTTILVVEDEPAIVELVCFTLREAGWNPVAVHNVADAWEFIQRRTPHLILLDWMLPDQTGLRLLSRIRSDRQFNELPVIMLTAKGMEEDKIAGLDNGADDYITKPFSPRELTARINALLRRKTPEHAQNLMTAGIVKLDPVSCNVSISEQKVDMGHAEFKLLKFFLAHPDRVFSRSQLLDKVWGDHVVIEERTVDVHVLRLRKALKEAEYLIKTVRSVGYMLSEK